MSSSKLDVIGVRTVAGRDSAPAVRGLDPHDEALRLFDAHAPSLVRYVRSIGLDGEASRDVVQETFLALFHHLRLERRCDNLKGWLFKVAHNLSLKHLRKAKRHRADVVDDLELAELIIDPSLNPEERLAEQQRQLRLHAVMRALPERDRECLYLRSEGLRYREIADILGASLGWVAKSVTRSLARLGNV